MSGFATERERSAGAGGVSVLATLSPVRPDRLARLRLRLAIVANTPGLGRPLLELNTIHYARWAVFSSLPHPDGSGRRWPLNWTYLYFDACYDGDEEEYVNLFSDVLPHRLVEVFGACFGFEANVLDAPGGERHLVPPAAFLRFIFKNELPVVARHARRPEAVTAIRAALDIRSAEERSDRQSGPALERTQARIRALATGPPAVRATFREAASGALPGRLRPARGVNPLTLVAPCPGGLSSALRRTRLDRLPGTHFARLEWLRDRMQQRLGHTNPDQLDCDYLIFSVDHDGTLDDYLAALHRHGAVLDDVFGGCPQYPGVADRRRLRPWVLRHRLRPQYYVRGYRSPTVGELAALLDHRDRIAAWALGTGAGE